MNQGQGWKKGKIPWNMVKICIENVKYLKEKDRKIHLNITFSLKIEKISLQKQDFLGIRFPNSTLFPCLTGVKDK